MKRNEFIKKSAACVALPFISFTLPFKPLNAQEVKAQNNTSINKANSEQVAKFLKFVESEMDESTKQKIFGKFGYECFHCTNAEKWIKNMDINNLIEFVNSGKSSRWERIEYSPEKSILKVTGRKVPCDCAYSQVQQPPKSLCNYCSKSFMKELFGTLLKKKVKVKIDESIILGGERCSSTITVS